MSNKLPELGDTVMTRLEWLSHAEEYGLVIGRNIVDGTCTVAWSRADGTIKFEVHVLEALRVIESDFDENELLRRRCIIA